MYAKSSNSTVKSQLSLKLEFMKKNSERKDTNGDKKVVGVMGRENDLGNKINVKYEFWMMQWYRSNSETNFQGWTKCSVITELLSVLSRIYEEFQPDTSW